jgi:hypothetical protein
VNKADSSKALGVKLDTVRFWTEHGNKMHAQRERPERGSVQAWIEAMKDVFVLQENSCSSMYSNYCVLISCNIVCYIICLHFLLFGKLIQDTDWCLFSQVKNKP